MYRKALALALLGVLLVGSGAVAYGTLSGDGLPASLAAVFGAEGDDEHEGREYEDEDEDDDHWRDD